MSERQYSVEEILEELALRKEKPGALPPDKEGVRSRRASDVLVDGILDSVKRGAYTQPAPEPAELTADRRASAVDAAPPAPAPTGPAPAPGIPAGAVQEPAEAVFTPAPEFSANTTVGLDAGQIREVMADESPTTQIEVPAKGGGFGFLSRHKDEAKGQNEPPVPAAKQFAEEAAALAMTSGSEAPLSGVADLPAAGIDPEQKSFLKQREEKVREFFGDRSFDEGPPEELRSVREQRVLSQETMVDSIPPYTQLVKERAGLMRRLLGVGIVTLFALYIAVQQMNPALLNPILGTEDLFLYAVVSTALIALGAVLCYDVCLSGLRSFGGLRLSPDTVCVLLLAVSIIQGVCSIVTVQGGTSEGVHVFALPTLLPLLVNLLAKLQLNKRLRLNSTCVESKADKYTIELMTDDLAREVGGTDVTAEPVVCTSVRSDRFGKEAGEEVSEAPLRVLTMLAFFGSLVIGLVTYFLYSDLYLAVSALAIALCMCMPMVWVFGKSQPLVLSAKRLSRQGAYIINAAEIERYCDTNALVLSERDILPRDAVLLQGIKTFGDKRIDEAIIDAASVACMAGGSISDVFLKIIENNTKILYTPDSIAYEDNLGLYAWINSKRILFGNRQLMINNGIDVPSKDYENKYMKGGRQLIYLSTSGELSAMFIISYSADPEVVRILKRLQKSKITVAIKVTDPNLTEQYVAGLFGIREEYLHIVPERHRQEIEERFGHQIVSGAGLVFDGQLDSYAAAVLGMGRLKTSLSLMTAACVMACLIGYAITFFLAVTSGLRSVDAIPLALYQMLWIASGWLMVHLL